MDLPADVWGKVFEFLKAEEEARLGELSVQHLVLAGGIAGLQEIHRFAIFLNPSLGREE